MVDAMIAASLCTGVVLVSRVGQVTKTELAQARAMLKKLNVIGVVANGVNGVNHGYAAAYTRENGQSRRGEVVTINIDVGLHTGLTIEMSTI
jgi:Mrp family chromosome partitioning ATPase